MNFWNALPLFRLIIPFLLGILFSDIFYFEQILYVNAIVFLTLFVVQKNRLSYSLRWLFGVLASLFMFGIGIWLTPNSLDFTDQEYFVNFLEKENILFLECLEAPQTKPNSFKVIAEVFAVNDISTKGRLLIYLDKELDSLHYGSRLIAKANPKVIASPSNPHQFNYSQLQFHRNISHQTYLSKEDVVVLDEVEGSDLQKNITSFRQKLLGQLKVRDLSPNEIAISSALLLGYKHEMEVGLKQTFSRTGVIHILAVSGLHIGIIYLMLNAMLKFMDKRFSLKLIKLIIVLICLWAYAFLTALSPSVMRAATLFSFLAIGSFIDRSSTIYNTLAASAFVLLLINPHFIYEVGFQLSYLAVLGIVSIYPKLYGLFQFKLLLLDNIWKLFCVSVAAQLVTFPLGIYYFHQFPNYFFVTNLLVVPLVPLIIYCGIGFLVFNKIAFLSEPFLYALKFLLQSLQHIVEVIEQWPFSISDFLYLDKADVLLIYTIVGTLLLAIYMRKMAWLNISLLLLLTFQLLQQSFQQRRLEMREIVFYSLKKHTAFGLVSNGEGVFFMSEDLLKDSMKHEYNLYNHWSYLGQSNPQLLSLDSNMESSLVWKNEQHIQLANSRILLVDEGFKLKSIDTPIEVDYCLISTKYSIKKLIESYRPKQIVLDATLPAYMLEELINECQELDLLYYDLNSQGALVAAF